MRRIEAVSFGDVLGGQMASTAFLASGNGAGIGESPGRVRAAKGEDLRVLVVRENWPGNTGLSICDALLRAGASADSIAEPDYVPLEWRRLSLRIVRRLIKPITVREFNVALKRACQHPEPDLFLSVKGNFVKADTLRWMREQGIVLYLLYPDVSMFSHGPYLPASIPEYDQVFTTKSFGPRDLRRTLGVENGIFIPPAFDMVVHRPWHPTPKLLSVYGCDVSFIGSWSPKKEYVLEALIKRRPTVKLRIWGNSWNRLAARSPLRQCTALKPLFGGDYAAAISCSKISLGLLSEIVEGASSGDLITTRTFEIPACGGLLLHERTVDLLRIFNEDESCVCFEGIDELVNKIDELLVDEERRRVIAARGREVVVSGHSWDHRVQTMLEHYYEHNPGGEKS